MTDTVLTFTGNGAQEYRVGEEASIVIEGTWGGGTMTHTKTGTSLAIRTPATADESYRTFIQNGTFTLTGATAPNLVVTIEPSRGWS